MWINSFGRKTNIVLTSIAATFVLFLLTDALFPFSAKIEHSQIVTDSNGRILHAFLTSDDKWRMKTELEEITPELQEAIVFKEDKWFYYHLGVNPIAIARAAFNNIFKGKRTSGASTITMQVARLLQPKSRTYGNKILEMWRALQLEWHFSKKEILQLYLNLVPYGGNIEGVKSAAVLYFDKAPNHLSIAEITTLAIIPNRPTSLLLGRNNDRVKAARNEWLQRFQASKVFDEQAIEDALTEPLNAKRLESPRIAPHFATRMKYEHPSKPIIKTTLQYNQQLKVEKLVSNYIQRIYHQRITNAAVLVLNNQTNQVEAYVGSADFFNSEASGQVDGVRSNRSPGSTLKPFLYGLAFDKGLLTSKYKISDVPTNFTGYSPINYSGEYEGLVTTEYALANSLNVPAVKVLDEMGVDYFLDKLSDAGFQYIKRNQKNLGLSVALGGCGVRLDELTALYAAFANKGQIREPQYIVGDTAQVNVPILSESGSFIITEILTQLTRPDLPKNIESSMNLPKIAWKTGTSYGRKDAWSVGYNGNYTVGVWCGNFSGEGVPDLSGATVATPLLFNIFNSIDYQSQKAWFQAPKELDFRWVCSESGLPPNEHCSDQVMDYYLPLVSNNRKCQHYQEVRLNPDESHAYCTSCAPALGFKKKIFPNYPPEIIAYYEKENIPYDKIPPHNPKCERVFSDVAAAPRITSPVNGLEYLIDPLDNTQLMLSCNAPSSTEKVYWYINDRFFQSATSTENLFFEPKEGKNKITCVDDKGRKEFIWVEVKSL